MKIFVNALTTSRLILAIILPFLVNRISTWAFVTFVAVIFLTDFLDGRLARMFKVQTLFGALMDAISDKVLNVVLAIVLIYKFKFFIAILVLELIILIANIVGWVLKRSIKSSLIGKAKMWFVGITTLIGFLTYFEVIKDIQILNVCIILTIIVQVITLADYIIRMIKQKELRRAEFNVKSFDDVMHILFDGENYKKYFDMAKLEEEAK